MAPAPMIDVFATMVVDPASVANILTSAERAQHERLTSGGSRARAATGRALLRAVAAERVGVSTDDVALTYCCEVCRGVHGKPSVRVPGNGVTMHLSVTSSDMIVLVAVADVPVGVDVERCSGTAFPGFDSVALSARERAEFGRTPALDRRTEIWVRKEAVLKVSGLGLSVPPHEIHIGRTHDGPVRVPTMVAADGWVSVAGVAVPDAYRAAVAVGGRLSPIVTVRDGSTLLAAGGVAVRTATA